MWRVNRTVPMRRDLNANCYGNEIAARDEKKVVSRKQKSVDWAENIAAVYVEDESNGAGAARSKRRSTCYGEEGDDEIVARDENLEAEETKKLKPNKEKRQVSLAEAAAKISPSSLETYLIKVSYWPEDEVQLLRFVDFFGRKLSDVQFSWAEMFKNPSLFKLNDVFDVRFRYLIFLNLSAKHHPIGSTNVICFRSVTLYCGRLIIFSLFWQPNKEEVHHILVANLRCQYLFP